MNCTEILRSPTPFRLFGPQTHHIVKSLLVFAKYTHNEMPSCFFCFRQFCKIFLVRPTPRGGEANRHRN